MTTRSWIRPLLARASRPPAARPHPPRWKMVVVRLLAVYPLICLVQLLLVPLLEDLLLPVRTLVTSVLLVCLMTYLGMPLMTHLFSGWLSGNTARLGGIFNQTGTLTVSNSTLSGNSAPERGAFPSLAAVLESR
jgi:hypothetical protein